MNNLTAKVAARIRTLRKQRGLTQEQLAFDANMHPAQIGHIERGVQSPTIDTLEKIIGALGVSIYEFFNFESVNLNTENALNLFLNTLSYEELSDISTILLILEKWKNKK